MMVIGPPTDFNIIEARHADCILFGPKGLHWERELPKKIKNGDDPSKINLSYFTYYKTFPALRSEEEVKDYVEHMLVSRNLSVVIGLSLGCYCAALLAKLCGQSGNPVNDLVLIHPPYDGITLVNHWWKVATLGTGMLPSQWSKDKKDSVGWDIANLVLETHPNTAKTIVVTSNDNRLGKTAFDKWRLLENQNNIRVVTHEKGHLDFQFGADLVIQRKNDREHITKQQLLTPTTRREGRNNSHASQSPGEEQTNLSA